MRRILLAGCAALALAGPANAQAVVTCTNCSTIAEQLIQYANEAQQLTTQLQILQTDIQTWENALTNTAGLPRTLFDDASSDIARITGIASTASLTIGNTGTFIANLSGDYPIGPLNNPMAEIIKEQQAISNAILALGNVLNVQNPTLGNNAAILAALNNQSMTSAGRMQALQAAQGVAATTGQSLQSMQTTLLAMAQGQSATMLAEHDRRAMEDKAIQTFSGFTPYSMSYSGY